MSNLGARVQALGWAHELDTAEQILADGPEFETWMAQSREQDEAYHLAERARCHVELYRKAILGAGVFDEEALLSRLRQHHESLQGRRARRVGIPATVTATLIAAIAVLAGVARTEQLLRAHFDPPIRQVSTVTLKDSPVVILDSVSPEHGVGAIAQIGPGGIRLEKAGPIGTVRRLRWIDGRLDFFDVPPVEAEGPVSSARPAEKTQER